MITISLTTLLPDFVDTRLFSSFFSNKQIVLRSNFKDSDSVLDDIQTDHCDMGFVVSDGLMLQPFETIELISLRPVLLIPLSNPMSQNKIISSDDLEGLSVVTSGRHTHLGKLLVNNHDKQPYKTDLIAESNNLTFNIEYARKMNAACLVFHSEQNKNFVDFKEVPLMTDAPIDYGLYAVRHKRGTVSPACEQFWNYIREYNFDEDC